MSTVFGTAATHDVEVDRNLFVNPRAETTAGLSATSGTTAPTFSDPTTSGMNVGGLGIDTFVRAEAVVASSYLDIRGTSANNVLQAGMTSVTVSAWIRPSAMTVTSVYVYVQQYDSAGVLVYTGDTGPMPLPPASGGWAELSFTDVVRPGVVRVLPIFRVMAAVPVGGRLDATAFKTGKNGDYFDGSYPNAVWAGAQNESESIEYSTVPDVFVVPEVVDGFRAAREARTIVHDVLGSADVDVSMRPVGLRRGVLQMVFADAVAASAGEDLAATTQLLTLTDPDVPTVGMTFVVAGGEIGLELNDETRSAWVLSVPFVEVAS